MSKFPVLCVSSSTYETELEHFFTRSHPFYDY